MLENIKLITESYSPCEMTKSPEMGSDDEDDSSQSSESDVDLEEGEILDSGAEQEEEKDFTNSSLKDALDESCLQNIEQLINQAKNVEGPVNPPTNHTKSISPHKMKRQGNFIDHDRTENNPDQNESWFVKSPKHKKSDSKPIDYRNELEAYRGTPPSSPDRKKRDDKRRKRSKSSKKSKKSSRKAITRKDAKGHRVMRYRKDAARGKPCKYFKEGKCAKGADCPFSHNVPERYKKKELCKFYLSGHCNKGSHCVYMHGEFPCKFYHTGSVCYAKEDCRFSHDPLTDEMKKVLADYLRHVHGDRDHHRDDFIREDERERDHDRGIERERKRHRSRSPEPPTPPSEAPPAPKRVCLLGSPPRRIRESEETKRWQEEMKMLQHQNHPSFEISLMQGDEEDEEMPPQFSRPNFYQETLLNSPQKPKIKQEHPDRLSHPSDFNQHHLYASRNMNDNSPPKNYSYEENFEDVDVPAVKQEPLDDFDWEDSRSMNDVKPKMNCDFDENTHSDLDFSNDIKFDETTQFSEMESSVDCPPFLSQSASSVMENKESDSEASNQDSNKHFKEKSDAGTANIAVEPPAPSIVIPSHLPRKQRELFMRVQQHNQQKQFNTSESTESQIKKECEDDDDEEKEDSKPDETKWYSSEDDDEDSDELLTDVLKKIQQAPPPPKPVESKPAVNLMAMLNKIQQNTMERTKTTTGSQQPNLLAPFLKDILGSVPPPTQPVTVPPALSIPGAPMIPDVKRRTLLPNPVAIPSDSFGSKETLPKPAPMDPRLKNRDPRTAPAVPVTSNAPKPVVSDNNTGNNSPSLDLNSVIKPPNMFPNEFPKDSVPYKLHGIYTRPPNYTPYLHASQSNPKLLNDPRLRKHLQPAPKIETPISNGKEEEISKPPPPPPKNVPPMPELLLKYEKPDSFINIFESNPSTKSSGNTQEVKHPLPMSAQRACDPRTIRRDSRSNSGSDTPPHLTIVETIKSPPQQEFKTAPILENALVEPVVEKKMAQPPVLEKSTAPPVLEKSDNVSIKSEPDSDSENSFDPPKLEFSGKTSFKKSPSPEREFIAIPKESPSHDGDDLPIVPPLIIKKIKPTPASHLPRAIADPRMAKLHNPVDPRRLRLASSEKSLVERKTQPLSKLAASKKPVEPKSLSDASKSPSGETETVEKEEKPKNARSIPKKRRLSDKGEKNVAESKNSSDASRLVETETAENEDKPKNAKTIPKKRRLSDKSEEKKRTVHRNRKSSMDYASPLNSCDATVPPNNSYNSYNQRPKRTTTLKSDRISNSPNLSSSDSSSIPSFLLSDSSNIDCDNSSDGNLKDRFKTIDPTASPFC
nr:zinc finger CCCH domain-containing protein 6 isoform X2 [Parasteatoda tepidariorum]